MAYVSIRWGAEGSGHLNYVLKDRGDEDVLYAHDCSVETANTDFENVRELHHKEGGNAFLHVVQSFSPGDSTKLSPEAFNAMGQKLAETNFPGHQFVVRTHTDTDKIHNHLIINTVNSETGRKIENKRVLIERLRESSDKFCKEYGLSVINREAHERRARLPYKVQQMVRAGKKSCIYDLSQQIDVARSISTNLDQYRDTLTGFGIRTVIEEKNISYFYPGKEKGKRGASLGRNYDIPGLIEAFRANHEKFSQNPDLRARFMREYEQIQKFGMPKSPADADRFIQLWDGTTKPWRGYEPRIKISRRESEARFKSDMKLGSAFVPAEEIKRARQGSIFEYCERNKIKLTKNTRGETVFTGREHVRVFENEFVNGKNGTRGSLIDLVAAHKNLTLLQSVAHTNGNKRLLLLEAHFGEVKHAYRSFYVPHAERAGKAQAMEKFGRLLTSLGASPSDAGRWQDEAGMLHVDKSGRIFLFPKEDTSARLEFVEREPGKWQRTMRGRARAPFYSRPGRGSGLIVFSEPGALFRHASSMPMNDGKQRTGILGLLEPDSRVVDRYLVENENVRSLQFVPANPGKLSSVELDFFNNLKTKLDPFGIEVSLVSHEKALHQTLEKERGRDSGLSL